MPAQRARELLRTMLRDPQAEFRSGQLECIVDCVARRARQLVVQKTGWGKSFVYFIATRLLRESGAGPTLLISPLLSLMRNQIAMAERIGIRAYNIDSTNREEWPRIRGLLTGDSCDVLLISPERLANDEFCAKVLPALKNGIGLFVVDEAHCISDWGHDFRPDYRRIRRFAAMLPETTPILATTATANDRVVEDISVQLGLDLKVVRGPLLRESLHLQVIELPSYAERLGWLVQNLESFAGSGIVYCLTKHDCEQVAAWLSQNNIAALPYHASLVEDEAENNRLRQEREEMLLHNRVKALVATVALGMGYDKPDLGFVIHFQRPGSIVAYYQQIGRAGRAIDHAVVVLLHGAEDDKINSYFIETAFPSEPVVDAILESLSQAADGISLPQMLNSVNQPPGKIERCLKYLEVEEVVAKTGSRYRMNAGVAQRINRKHQAMVTDRRFREMEAMKELCAYDGCYMSFIGNALDDPHCVPCGKCANCTGKQIEKAVDPRLIQRAVAFLKQSEYFIAPRKMWPAASATHWKVATIGANLRIEPGRALCEYFDAGWGQRVHDGKYCDGDFSNELVEASCELIVGRWRPRPYPGWVASVPSLRHPRLVSDFARRLAIRLAIPYLEVLVKIKPTAEQKLMQNRVQQVRNLAGAFQVRGEEILRGPVLLVDDIVDSRWTLTYTGALLREAGAGKVFPFALAYAGSGLG